MKEYIFFQVYMELKSKRNETVFKKIFKNYSQNNSYRQKIQMNLQINY